MCTVALFSLRAVVFCSLTVHSDVDEDTVKQDSAGRKFGRLERL